MTRGGIVLKSLWSRRLPVLLTVTGIALSVMMILGVERIRLETRAGFQHTVAGIDLIVGARTSPMQLLLYSVFRIGDATNDIAYSSFEKITRHPMVDWAVPVSLGDSHRGFRVVGTTDDFFRFVKHGESRALSFASGGNLNDRFDTVLGAQVAKTLGHAVGDSLTIAHGTRDHGLARHDALPFVVRGILAPTGTPVDRSVFVGLAAIEAIHVGWESGVRISGQVLAREQAETIDLQPESLTAFYLGLGRRSDVLQMQRAINQFPAEPLTAILPGVALNELWGLFGTAEFALIGVAAMAVVTGLLGMAVGLFSTLNERRREMAVLRAVGARPLDIFGLFVAESTLIGLAGVLAGFLLLTSVMTLANPLLAPEYGLSFSSGWPDERESILMAMVVGLCLVTGALPAWRAYGLSLQDGLNAGF